MSTGLPPNPECWRIALNQDQSSTVDYAETKKGVLIVHADKAPRLVPRQMDEYEMTVERIRSGTGLLTLNEYYALSRRAIARMYEDSTGKDIYRECGYPDYITPIMYKQAYARNGVATRVVDIYPEEAMTSIPDIVETDDDTENTPFEESVEEHILEKNLFHYILRACKQAGIGTFAGFLIGINDGKQLNEPVDGIDLKTGEMEPNAKVYKVLYYNVFDESQIHVAAVNTDHTSPRCGQPEFYLVQFVDPTTVPLSQVATEVKTRIVHWTRMVHLTLNPGTNNLYSPPELECVWNRCQDVDKILSGSGEMFWKGAFPGYAFETDPDLMDPLMDKESIKEEMDEYSRGLKRWIAVTGMKVNSLAPQIGDPTAHVNAHTRIIAMSKKVPWRIFIGSEAAQMASEQDMFSWNVSCNRWLLYNCTPQVVRPIIDRHILLRCVPKPAKYKVKWPDLNMMTPNQTADWFLKYMQALSTAVGGGVDQIIAPEDILIEFGKMNSDKVITMFKRAIEHLSKTDGGFETPQMRQQAAQIDADAEQAAEDRKAQKRMAQSKPPAGTKPNNGGMR